MLMAMLAHLTKIKYRRVKMLTVEDVRNKQIRNVKRSILIVVLIVIGCWIIATIGVYYDPEMHQFRKSVSHNRAYPTSKHDLPHAAI